MEKADKNGVIAWLIILTLASCIDDDRLDTVEEKLENLTTTEVIP